MTGINEVIKKNIIDAGIFISESEYKDALAYFDLNPGIADYEKLKTKMNEIFIEIHKKYGNNISSKRLNYLLMKDYDAKRETAQRLMRLALTQGIYKWDDHLRVQFN